MPIFKNSKQLIEEITKITKEIDKLTVEMEEKRNTYFLEMKVLNKKRSILKKNIQFLYINNILNDLPEFRELKQKQVFKALGKCLDCSINMSGNFSYLRSRLKPNLCYSCAKDGEGVEEDGSYFYRPGSQVG